MREVMADLEHGQSEDGMGAGGVDRIPFGKKLREPEFTPLAKPKVESKSPDVILSRKWVEIARAHTHALSHFGLEFVASPCPAPTDTNHTCAHSSLAINCGVFSPSYQD